MGKPEKMPEKSFYPHLKWAPELSPGIQDRWIQTQFRNNALDKLIQNEQLTPEDCLELLNGMVYKPRAEKVAMALRCKSNAPTPSMPSTSSQPVDRSTPNISKTEMLMRAAELKVVNSWNRDKA